MSSVAGDYTCYSIDHLDKIRKIVILTLDPDDRKMYTEIILPTALKLDDPRFLLLRRTEYYLVFFIKN